MDRASVGQTVRLAHSIPSSDSRARNAAAVATALTSSSRRPRSSSIGGAMRRRGFAKRPARRRPRPVRRSPKGEGGSVRTDSRDARARSAFASARMARAAFCRPTTAAAFMKSSAPRRSRSRADCFRMRFTPPPTASSSPPASAAPPSWPTRGPRSARASRAPGIESLRKEWFDIHPSRSAPLELVKGRTMDTRSSYVLRETPAGDVETRQP